jgi:hypothetical protein
MIDFGFNRLLSQGRKTMKNRSEDIAEKIKAFNDKVVRFVENCSEQDWQKLCVSEDWTVDVVARHIGAGHYSVVELVRMIIDGEKLPDLTMEDIIRMSNEHAREHAKCTREKVHNILLENGEIIASYVAALDDNKLDRTGHLAATGGEVTAGQLIEYVVFQSANEHFESMKSTVGS